MELIVWFAFSVSRFFVHSLQNLWWRYNGITNTLKLTRAGELYEQSAHILDIHWRYKWDVIPPTEKCRFIATHNRFEHPRCILADVVSLIYLDENEALFVETPPNVDIYNSDTNPFVYMAQYKYAIRLIVLPMASFHKIADEIGDPKTDVLLLSNTGRCGSTAVTQILESVPGVLAMSEPDGFTCLQNVIKTVHHEKVDRYVQSVTRVTCKPLSSNPRLICIKTRSMCFLHADKVANIAPGIKHLFLYRDGKATIQSFYHAFGNAPTFTFWHSMLTSRLAHCIVPKQSRHLWNWFIDIETYPEINDKELMLRSSVVGILVGHWSCLCGAYKRFKASGMAVKAFKYEDILENPRHACESLLAYCGLPMEYAGTACKALSKDAQRGMYKTRTAADEQGDKYHIKWTPQFQAEADFFCDYVGVTRIGEPTALPDTISSL
ncbi:uncharacterized protein LOC112042692 [Lingula anatina]|uniref:Uncharacterized protein LOC112042692 n=1 Tax=Lingula anatina TaxID=7574 RepID=A0A2R2MTU4_LINAN|nr:uncharacterized protein LOC112042692 [Lingula anatina]|eukprot:XP_023933437.1 uncharacterized protein LOC112042692 [Lingula anatina]